METIAKEPARSGLVDSVLLIDADNDPHMPAEFPLSSATLVRVFLRPKAVLSRALQKRLTGLPLCATIAAPQGGKNAADFVMSMHAGLLHASLPMHIPFSIVTNDKALSAIVQELQRVGRVATLWTSHPDRAEQVEASSARRSSSRTSRPRRGGRGRGRAAKAATPAAPEAPTPSTEPAAAPQPPVAPSKSLEEVTAVYERMLSRAKNPPSRLKALLNDIGNRTANFGYPAEAVLEELKRSHGLLIDERGHVSRQ